MAVKRSISYKFSSAIITFVLLILVIILYSVYDISKELLLGNAKRDAENLTIITIDQVNDIFTSIEEIPEEFAIRLLDENFKRDDAKIALMSLIQRIKLLYGSCIAIEPYYDGQDTVYYAPYLYRRGDSVLFKNLAGGDYQYHLQDWYTIPKKLNKAVWSQPYFDEGGGERLMVTYSVPFYRTIEGKNTFAGVVTADLSLKHLQEIISSIRFYESGYAMLITEKAKIVTHPDIDYATADSVIVITDWVKDETLLSVIHRMLNGEKDIVSLEESTNNQISRDWISFASIPSTGWSVAILFDESDIYGSIYSLMLKLFILGTGGLLALGLIIIQRSKKVTRPLKLLTEATKEIGLGKLDVVLPEIKAGDEVAELGLSIKSMQQDLISYIENLKKTTAEKEQIESEIKIASQIQMSMIPQEIPSPELINGYSIAGYIQPAKEVGGDFYDFIISGNKLYFAIGDVSGKGVPAALFMAKAITLFRAKAEKKIQVERIASEMNNDLCKYNDNAMFVTFFIGMLDFQTESVEYCNAGHNPPLLQDGQNNISRLKLAHGLPLGLMPDQQYGKDQVNIVFSSRLIMFTDGITEAENITQELFGEERLKDLLLKHHKEDNTVTIQALCEEIHNFVLEAGQSDDITLLLLSKPQSSSSSGPLD